MKVWPLFPWPRENPGPWAGVWIESVGSRDCTRYNSNADPDFLCVHLLTKGQLRFRAGQGVNVLLRPGGLFTIWPHVSCELSPEPPCAPDEVEMDWLRLSGPLRGEFAGLLGTPPDRPWARAAHPRQVRALIGRLRALAKSDPPQADLLAASTLHQLAAACARPSPGPVSERSLAQRIKEAMEQHLASGMNVTDYAQAFRVSRSKLFQMFKDAFGQSPIRILTGIRIDCARGLLRGTALTIKEIAFASGYQDPLYFSREFRKRAGVPPRRFRASRGGSIRRKQGTNRPDR